MAESTLSSRPLHRPLSLVSVGALILGTLPATMAAADEHDEPRDTDFVCYGSYDAEFEDLSEDNTHFENILCAADHTIARGHADGTYRPANGVRRDQMASFITRLIEHASGDELEEGDEDFDDVPEGNEHADNIRKLANIDVVEGFAGGDYRPGRTVTRDQMASFIARAISYLDNEEARDGSEPPPAEEDHFEDVGEDSSHYAAINALAEQDIVAGDGEGNYQPRRAVRRDQMASFLMRGYDYAVEAMLVLPPFLQGPGNGDEDDNGDENGEESEGPSVEGVGSMVDNRIEVVFDDGVTVVDLEGFEVFTDDECTEHLAHGTEVNGDGGPFLGVELSQAMGAEVDHWFRLAAGAVEDGDEVANEESDCLEIMSSPTFESNED